MVKQTTHNRWSLSSILRRPTRQGKYFTMEQNKQPVKQFYYSDKEWDRLGCGPLPAERDRARQTEQVIARLNPWQDKNIIKGSN